MIVQITRFKSGLSDEEVLEKYEARARQYRAIDGLRQKYYLRFPATGEHGGLFLWDSEDALEAFRASNLARTIADAYRVDGAPDIQVAEVVMVLHPESEPVGV